MRFSLSLSILILPAAASAGPTFGDPADLPDPIAHTGSDQVPNNWNLITSAIGFPTVGHGTSVIAAPNGNPDPKGPCAGADPCTIEVGLDRVSKTPGRTLKLRCGTYNVTSGLVTSGAGALGEPIGITYDSDPNYGDCRAANSQGGDHVVLRAAFALNGGPATSTPILTIGHSNWSVYGLVFQTRARTTHAISVQGIVGDVENLAIQSNRIEIGVVGDHAECLVTCDAQTCQNGDSCRSDATGIELNATLDAIETSKITDNTLVDLYPRLEGDPGGIGIAAWGNANYLDLASNRIIGNDTPGLEFSGWANGMVIVGAVGNQPHHLLLNDNHVENADTALSINGAQHVTLRGADCANQTNLQNLPYQLFEGNVDVGDIDQLLVENTYFGPYVDGWNEWPADGYIMQMDHLAFWDVTHAVVRRNAMKVGQVFYFSGVDVDFYNNVVGLYDTQFAINEGGRSFHFEGANFDIWNCGMFWPQPRHQVQPSFIPLFSSIAHEAGTLRDFGFRLDHNAYLGVACNDPPDDCSEIDDYLKILWEPSFNGEDYSESWAQWTSFTEQDANSTFAASETELPFDMEAVFTSTNPDEGGNIPLYNGDFCKQGTYDIGWFEDQDPT